MSNNYLFGSIDSTYATMTQEDNRVACHWQILSDGKETVSLNVGRIGIHLTPMAALRIAEMLERVVRDFHDTQRAREAAEYELQVGLRDAYGEPEEETNVEYAA